MWPTHDSSAQPRILLSCVPATATGSPRPRNRFQMDAHQQTQRLETVRPSAKLPLLQRCSNEVETTAIICSLQQCCTLYCKLQIRMELWPHLMLSVFPPLRNSASLSPCRSTRSNRNQCSCTSDMGNRRLHTIPAKSPAAVEATMVWTLEESKLQPSQKQELESWSRLPP